MSDWTWYERLMCKLGFHSEWHDNRGINIGTEETPIYFMETVTRCHRCPWQDPREN